VKNSNANENKQLISTIVAENADKNGSKKQTWVTPFKKHPEEENCGKRLKKKPR